MPFAIPETGRFVTEDGVRITVQVPKARAQAVVDAVLSCDPLRYGDYDSVTFQGAPGIQTFRSLGSGRNAASDGVVKVACVEVSFFLGDDAAALTQVLTAIYAAHPYEEPVIFVQPCLRSLHVRGMDEDNPNRFWNRPADDWVPEPFR